MKTAGNVLDIATWHYYPLVSNRSWIPNIDPWVATPQRVLEPSTLNQIIQWADEIWSWIGTYAPQAQIWIGETSSASMGGKESIKIAQKKRSTWSF